MNFQPLTPISLWQHLSWGGLVWWLVWIVNLESLRKGLSVLGWLVWGHVEITSTEVGRSQTWTVCEGVRSGSIVGLLSPNPIQGAETLAHARFCFLWENEPWSPDRPTFQKMPEIWISSWNKPVLSQAKYLRDSTSCQLPCDSKFRLFSLLGFTPMLNQTEPHIRDSCRLHWSASVTTSSSRVGPGHGEVWVGAAEANWDPGSRADPFPSSDDVCQNLHCSEVQLCPGLGDRMG